MNEYDIEIALLNIQKEIIKKIRENKNNDLQDLKQEMQELFSERNEIMLGNKDVIKKYVKHKCE